MNLFLTILALYYSALLTTFLPWVIPLVYAFIAGMLIRGVDPFIVAIVVFVGAVSGTLFLWLADDSLITWFQKKGYLKRFDGIAGDSWIKRTTTKIHEKLQVVSKKWALFLLTCFTTWSAVPDFVVIRCVREKLGFSLFLLATLVGKAFVYTPVIYGVELIDFLVRSFM